MRWKIAVLIFFGSTMFWPRSNCLAEDQLVSIKLQIVGSRVANKAERITEKPIDFPVTVTLGKNQWLIESGFSANTDDFYHFDGTNITGASVFNERKAESEEARAIQKKIEALGIGARNPSTNQIAVQLFAGPLPFGNMGVNIPWLAYCSAAYLKQAGRRIPLTCAVLVSDTYAFGYRDETVTFPSPWALPKTVKLFTCKDCMDKAVADPEFPLARGWHPLETPDDQEVFHYEVISSTNVLNMTIPLSFIVEQKTLSNNLDLKWLPCFRLEGKVLSMEVVKSLPRFPPKGSEYLYTDYRLLHPAKMSNPPHYSLPVFDVRYVKVSDTIEQQR